MATDPTDPNTHVHIRTQARKRMYTHVHIRTQARKRMYTHVHTHTSV